MAVAEVADGAHFAGQDVAQVAANVWSESIKKIPDPLVISWLKANEANLYVSALSIGEIKFGIERLGEGVRKREYQMWLTGLTGRMKGRILSFNDSVATVWGQLLAECERSSAVLPTIDGQIAATAIRHSLVISTRNMNDFRKAGVRTYNPFK
ncbi:MAG: putative nucleic acid-binding protein [Verrucomicrobiales bacterium]